MYKLHSHNLWKWKPWQIGASEQQSHHFHIRTPWSHGAHSSSRRLLTFSTSFFCHILISYILLSVVYIFPTFSSQIYFYNKETCSNIKSYTTIIVCTKYEGSTKWKILNMKYIYLMYIPTFLWWFCYFSQWHFCLSSFTHWLSSKHLYYILIPLSPMPN